MVVLKSEPSLNESNLTDDILVAAGIINLSVWIKLMKNVRHVFHSCFQPVVLWKINFHLQLLLFCLAPGLIFQSSESMQVIQHAHSQR